MSHGHLAVSQFDAGAYNVRLQEVMNFAKINSRY